MPYITTEARYDLDNGIRKPESAGELNYVITKALLDYHGEHSDRMGYVLINELVGVLECAKLELYRRLAAPYEDEKAEANGDVYETEERPLRVGDRVEILSTPFQGQVAEVVGFWWSEWEGDGQPRLSIPGREALYGHYLKNVRRVA